MNQRMPRRIIAIFLRRSFAIKHFAQWDASHSDRAYDDAIWRVYIEAAEHVKKKVSMSDILEKFCRQRAMYAARVCPASVVTHDPS